MLVSFQHEDTLYQFHRKPEHFTQDEWDVFLHFFSSGYAQCGTETYFEMLENFESEKERFMSEAGY